MGCHPDTLARMMRNRREHPDSADYWSNQIIDATTRATDWDAEHWGLDPHPVDGARAGTDLERVQMERRIRCGDGRGPVSR